MNIKVYQQGLKFLFINAVKKLYKGEVYFQNSLDHGIQAEIKSDINITEREVEEIKREMNQMISSNLSIHKRIVSKKDAYNFYKKRGLEEKAQNILRISNISVSLFELEGDYNYFYCHDMPETTGELKQYDLYYVKPNQIIITYPTNGEMQFKFRKNIFENYEEMRRWSTMVGINYVSDINDLIAKGKMDEFIRKNDLLVDVAYYVACQKIIGSKKKIVLLAGPSSSGKTTSSKKIADALQSLGYNARTLTLDDYFLEKEETPVLPDGKKDFESLRALDLDLFNDHINKLLKGEEVTVPSYNFVSGIKEYPNPPIKMQENEILVIEGLHAINPDLFKTNMSEEVFKIYISPFSPLKIDRHNYLSSTDNRLIRRIARDFRTRGRSAEQSLLSWASVREGEEKYIFPFTDNVDYILNTSAVYEIGVLKVMVEPLLYDVPMDSEAYEEARRLLDSLRTFYPISSEYVSRSSVLREFIGGSIYDKEVS